MHSNQFRLPLTTWTLQSGVRMTVAELRERLRDLPGSAKVCTRMIDLGSHSTVAFTGGVNDIFRVGENVYLNGIEHQESAA
jgi:hypothetical protein